jgi:cohesin loading factor subunit SCC2
VTPTPLLSRKKDSPPVGQKRADIVAEQMMHVVRDAQTGEYLESLLRILLASDKNEAASCEARSKECQLIVDSLVELLLKVEEDRSRDASLVGKDIAASLRTIDVFATVRPQLVLRHAETILPYLKADNSVPAEDETCIVSAACNIIFRLTSSMEISDLQRISSQNLVKDLVQIIYRFGGAALESAIRVFCALAHHRGVEATSMVPTKLLGVSQTFYSLLYRNSSSESSDGDSEKKTRSHTHRALRALGLICQHSEMAVGSTMWDDEEFDVMDDGVLPASIEWTTLAISCYRVFTVFLAKKDYLTKSAALRALGAIFVSQPRLLLRLDQVGLIADVMSEATSPMLQLEALQCWQNILKAEEKRIESGAAQAKMNKKETATLSKKISGDLDGDATLFGGVLTSHAPRLFDMTQAPDPKIRFAAVELLGILLRQGLVNPNEAIPYLFALQGDVSFDNVRSLALKLLVTEGEKRPDAVRQYVSAGVKKAYSFQRVVYPRDNVPSALITVKRGQRDELECIFNCVFTECVANTRKQRYGLFSSLLGLFEVNKGGVGDRRDQHRKKKREGKPSAELPLLSFVSEILAYLPYRAAGDALYIIHRIDETVTLVGSQILDRFADLFQQTDSSGNTKFDDSNTTEDALERAASSKFPSRSADARFLSVPEFDWEGFHNLCRESSVIVLLLRLKKFLRALYSLSETRCMEYDPSAKERIADKGITKSDSVKPFDSSLASERSVNKAKGKVDKDALIRQYAEFRRLMRHEMHTEPSAVEDNSNGQNSDSAAGD